MSRRLTTQPNKPVKDAIAEAQGALDSDAPKSRLDELVRDLSEKVAALQQAAPPQNDDSGEAQPQAEDDVVDADFKPAG